MMTYCAEDGQTKEKYEGDWFEDKMHGKGKYWYADGSLYDGQWHDSKMNGKGVYTYPNQDR